MGAAVYATYSGDKIKSISILWDTERTERMLGMKKIVSFGVVLVLVISACLQSFATMTDGYGNELYTFDFKDGVYTSTTMDSKTGVTVVSSPVDEQEHGYVAKVPIVNKDTGARTDNYLRNQYKVVNPGGTSAMLPDTEAEKLKKVRLTCDVMLTEYMNVNLTAIFQESTSSRPNCQLINLGSNGKYRVYKTGKWEAYNLNEWYSFTIYIDFDAGTYTTYLNGDPEPIAKDTPFTEKGNYVLSWGVQFGAVSTTVTENDNACVYVDNISYYTPVDPAVESVTPAADSTGFPVAGGEAVFAFNNPLAEDAAPSVTVADNAGAVVTGVTSEISGNHLTVRIGDKLAYDTDYTITVPAGVTDCNGRTTKAPAALTVHTMPAAPNSEPIQFTGDTSGGTVSTTVHNPGAEPFSAALVTAAYDETGNMVSHQITKKEIAAGGSDALTTSVTFGSEGSALASGSEAENIAEAATPVRFCAFVVDGETMTQPLYPNAVEMTAEGGGKMLKIPNYDTPEITLDTFKPDNGTVLVSGSVSPAKESLIFVRVDYLESLNMILPIITEEDGAFSLVYSPKNFKDGKYTVSIGGWQTDTVSGSAVCFSDETKAEILEAVNNANSAEAMRDALAPYQHLLNIDAACFCENGYQTLCEQKRYGEIDDILAVLKNAQSMLQTVNKTNWADLPELLLENEDILLYQYGETENFSAAQRAVQNKICSYMVDDMPFDSFVDMRTSLSAAIRRYREEQAANDNKLPGSTGGGNGGGTGGGRQSGGTNVLYVGGAVADIKPEQKPPAEIQPPATAVFSDLGDAQWAEGYITSLTQKGIISGDNGRFRPNDSITREEFVKLLLGALQITPGGADSGFADAQAGAWYGAYLSAAREAGIVSGDENGRFGVGQAITRQDMAVMVCRAMAKRGKELPQGEVTFTDSGEISAYAVEAVGQMQQAGILSGNGDGSFMPLVGTSRAQAAKVIDSLMNLIDRG